MRGRPLSDRERLDRAQTGTKLTRDIVNAGKRLGWLVHHSRPGVYQVGGRWATQLQGHTGLPDIILVRPPDVLFIEVKRQVGEPLSAMQKQWGEALLGCPVEYRVVRPSDFEALILRLAEPVDKRIGVVQ